MLHSIINMKNRNNKFQHKLAKLNYYQSVEKVFDLESKETNLILFGVKNVQQVPKHLVELLEKSKKYRLHTTDSYALGGRAIDLRLNNPITGRYMTGSSSGTAINVFVGINDIGIGIDGGGSVLGPAMSLNLFGFISPLICYQHMRKFKKRSTDGIEFSPSVGLMARDFQDLEDTINMIFDLPKIKSDGTVFISKNDNAKYPFTTHQILYPDIFKGRESLIKFLLETLPLCDVLISTEGPIDLHGFGDSIFGHFDCDTSDIQEQSKKGLIRVINMAGATAINVPNGNLGSSYVLICESTEEKIKKLLLLANQLRKPKSSLIERYFGNLEMYFMKGFEK